MIQTKATIISHREVKPGYRCLAARAPAIAQAIGPGQFLHIRCSDAVDPLLRRPFSVHRVARSGGSRLGAAPDSVEILYEVVGRGTEILSRRKVGELIDIIGPLGNGFSFKRTTHHDRRESRAESRGSPRTTILIAGGIGVAPLVALAEEQAASFKRGAFLALIGAKTKDQVLSAQDFRKAGADVIIATEDGSQGKKGLVTDALKDFLRTTTEGSPVLRQAQHGERSRTKRSRGTHHDRRESRAESRGASLITIYACGPHGMLKAVAGIARVYRIPCQVSLEERMACGVGACLGCPVRIKTRHPSDAAYKMVCKDGPVFDAAEIAWGK